MTTPLFEPNHRRARRRLLGAGLWISSLFLLSCGGGSAPPPPPPEAVDLAWATGWSEKGWSLVLITLDTTRRDALGCYGNPAASTASLDSLALEGVLFEHAFASVPMTLPSHTTLMTGLDPHEHGVRDNGHSRVPDSLTTLAERFAARGYETAAFVSAFPLDRQFGLDQGFGVYDDDFDEQASALNAETAERRGGHTTDAALRWVRSRADGERPLFLWVHYFDPHEPYEPPAPFSTRMEDPYLGEVSYMDHEVGRLLSGLRESGLLATSFVLAVGDHGESRDEHGERTHSFFVYDATQAVPCLVSLPSGHPERSGLRGTRVSDVFRLRDIVPTVANLLGWKAEAWTGSRATSAAAALRGAPVSVPVAYMETLTPLLEYGWSDLRAVRAANWKYIRAPHPELYDLRKDPGETVNLVSGEPEIVAAMERWLDWYLESETEATPAEEMDPEVLARLRSLGYLQGGGALGPATMADPKARLDAFQKVGEAQLLAAQFRNEEAIRLFESVVRQDPENASLLRLLGSTYAQARKWEDATRVYDRLLELVPTEPQVLREAAQVAMLSGDRNRALDLLGVLQSVAPTEDVWRLRGETWEYDGNRQRAIEVYEAHLEDDPQSSGACEAIARNYRALGDPERAEAFLRRAVTVDPADAGAWADLAALAFGRDQPERGDSLLAKALEADPRDARASFRLGWRQSALGNGFAAVDAYERAVAARPDWVEARMNFGNALLAIQEPRRALVQFEVVLSLGEETALLRTNQGVAFAQLGQLRDAVGAWQRALELGPDPATAAGLQRNIQQAIQQLPR